MGENGRPNNPKYNKHLKRIGIETMAKELKEIGIEEEVIEEVKNNAKKKIQN